MAPTDEQLLLASSLDARMEALAHDGITEPLAIVGAMADAMPAFKRILDTAPRDVMDDLCVRFPGFYRYAEVLEWLARKLRSGEIVAPK